MISESSKIEQTLARHAREHEALARLSQLALRDHQVGTLIDEIVAIVVDTLGLELCGVSRLREDGEALDILLSVGPPDPPRSLPVGPLSQAGYALLTNQPVVTEDLLTETRFESPGLLSMGMRSGVSAIIEGHERPFGILSAHTCVPRRFSDGDVNFLVAVANVLSAALERNRREEAALHAALHDPLTGLPNRNLALDRLDLALARRRRSDSTVALLLIDLDRFTLINDSLGHAAGDEVLRTLAARLRTTIRPSDTVARMTADEFALVCESEGGVHGVVDLARRIGTELGRPLTIDRDERSFSVSIGIAVADDPEESASSMLRDADAAIRLAKLRGPGSHELFDQELRSKVLSRLRIETELQRAIRDGQLCVHYQPIVELASGRAVAVEALVRWQHPDHGLIPPLDFVPVAEEAGLIGELGRFVLERACDQGTVWQRAFQTPLRMFLNVSGMQVVAPSFVKELITAARTGGLLPGTLGIEVTESILIEEGSSAPKVLGTLRERGIRVVLDDFGTGYSSLSYLRTLPLDGVKIDRSFIDGMGKDRDGTAIVKAIVDMCHTLGLATVAEGVESEAQLTGLGRLGCQHVQGYLLCPPMAPPEVGSYLGQHAGSTERPAPKRDVASRRTDRTRPLRA